MNAAELKPGIIVRGPVLPEPIEVLVVTPLGDVIKLDALNLLYGTAGLHLNVDDQTFRFYGIKASQTYQVTFDLGS